MFFLIKVFDEHYEYVIYLVMENDNINVIFSQFEAIL